MELDRKEIPVTYEGIMVGVAKVSGKTEEGISVLSVRLNSDSELMPFFVDHTLPSISFQDDRAIRMDQPYYPQDEEYDPKRLCNSCDKPYGHIPPCGEPWHPTKENV